MSVFAKYLDKILDRYEPRGSKYLWWQVQKKYTELTVEFIAQNMTKALYFSNPLDILEYAATLRKPGLVAEFGVYSGITINQLAKFIPETIYGFDSFEGLPEQWSGFIYAKKMFDRKGTFPEVKENVKLIKGWFNETVPPFFQEQKTPVSILHIDSDIYSSAVTVLEAAEPFIQSGTILIFDEFFNYPGYQQHEFKAFFEFCERTKMKYEFLAYSGNQVALKFL